MLQHRDQVIAACAGELPTDRAGKRSQRLYTKIESYQKKGELP